MKKFETLSPRQKVIFYQIENVFLLDQNYTIRDFITVLGVLINKYKKCQKNKMGDVI